MKLKISITKEHYTKARFCKTNSQIGKNCAVALALIDFFPSVDLAYSDKIIFDGLEDKIELDPRVSRIIGKFDDSTPDQRINLEPFSFEIEVPESVIDSIDIEQVKDRILKSEHLEIVE